MILPGVSRPDSHLHAGYQAFVDIVQAHHGRSIVTLERILTGPRSSSHRQDFQPPGQINEKPRAIIVAVIVLLLLPFPGGSMLRDLCRRLDARR